ncbi:MAG: WD40/YVTN/BNR-like repeat-containing protein, partial [Acidimicrobiia bacterium]
IDFEPIFDDQPVTSIGAVVIDQSNPDVIWVGSGEGNPRNSQASGNGLYKSLDGGHTWTHLGLDDSRNIHRILIHPGDPNTVYVGAQGPAWGETEERGVFKTTDGGQTWDKILYLNERTGIGDLVMDPDNPDKLIATMWEFRRWPWFFKSGGEGSGLYVTFDGGENWEKRTDKDGLPKGELGRIGLAIAPSNPDVVYAVIESKKSAFYRSDDGGFTFKKTKGEGNFGNRPFYYFDIYVDPVNENRVYSIHSRVTYSEDGGETWKSLIGREVHPDHHAWWIHPDNPNLIYEGNDGGMAISRDRGETWRFVENLPLAQFYHIRVDMETPYRVCGGLQDNGSWCGPSQVWRSGGIRNAYWEEVAFGDGFDVMIHPDDPNTGYAMSQGGNVRRFDLVTGYQKNIKPIHPDGTPLRFNWNAGIAQDPFDANTIYYGSQFLHKSTDQGDSWTIISPDLTTNDPEKQKQLETGGLTYDNSGAENFTTIIAIDPSPLDRNVLWVGTDDGNVQVTRDGGQHWENVVGNIDGVPEGTWVPHFKASKHDAGEAFVVFDDHRRNNWEPYVYRTRDFGQSWERLADSDDVWGYALAIEQDPVASNLLFLGTEFGLYISIDDGATWTQFTNGFPTASTMDLVVHPRDHDLVIGTFGRAIYILDDIRPLRALAQQGVDLLNAPLV